MGLVIGVFIGLAREVVFLGGQLGSKVTNCLFGFIRV